MTIELGYSYVNLGDGTTGVDSTFDGRRDPIRSRISNITSNDVKLGVRWNLDSPRSYAPPLVRKG